MLVHSNTDENHPTVHLIVMTATNRIIDSINEVPTTDRRLEGSSVKLLASRSAAFENTFSYLNSSLFSPPNSSVLCI